MASTTALYTGLSGMTANARRLDVIGNNIANANTTAFKSSRMLFESQFAQTIRDGVPADNLDGGSNPYQIGLGVSVAGTQRDFTVGSISATGDPRDLAIQGNGFFITSRGTDTVYTRAGGFRQNVDGDLTNVEGDKLLGYGVDANFNIQPGALKPINIPLGKMQLAQQTKNLNFQGALDAGGDVATQGSSITLGGTPTSGLSLIPGATRPATAPDVLETSSLLSEVADPLSPTAALFATGQKIEVTGAQRGTATLPDSSFTIGAASTVQDLMTFLTNAMGIDPATGANPNGPTPGVALNTATGTLTMTGNTGTVNDLELANTRIRLLDADGTFVRNPLDTSKTASADGESLLAPFEVYDSLGNPVDAEVRMTLQSKGDNGTIWRYDVDSQTPGSAQPAIATGTLQFDTLGQLTTTAPVQISINRAGQGSGTPLTLDLHFAHGNDSVRALADPSGAPFIAGDQDGAAFGVLTSFGVADDGTVVGVFSNGLSRPLGQVALATFTNQEGLTDVGQNAFRPSGASGDATITTPGQNASGKVVSGALELSNVDLGQEFINMILTSTGYSASSRVIQTSDELLQQLLVLGR